jgi:hypothetical protein
MPLKELKNGGIGRSTKQIADFFANNPGSQDKTIEVLINTAKTLMQRKEQIYTNRYWMV